MQKNSLTDFGTARTHREPWTSEELCILYQNYHKSTLRQLARKIPTRTFSAIKNKVKQVKFSKCAI